MMSGGLREKMGMASFYLSLLEPGDLQMKMKERAVGREFAEQKLKLMLGILSELTVGLPVRDVIQALGAKDQVQKAVSPQRKEIMELCTESGESWEVEGGDKDGTWGEGSPPQGLITPVVMTMTW